jgi:hypothetical protein
MPLGYFLGGICFKGWATCDGMVQSGSKGINIATNIF